MAELLRRLYGRVREAWIFGSIAREDYCHNSDVDLILVADTDMDFVDRPRMFLDLWDLTDRLDLLVYTPEEFQQLVENPSVGFWQSVVREMKRIL